MRKVGFFATIALIVAACITWAVKSDAQVPETASSPASAEELKTDSVEKGRYKATLAGCNSCHQSPDGRPWAGGTELKTPFGPLAAANITPDPKTGIGAWSKPEFVAALRQGKRPDGQLLYPGMPYLHYTKMSDEDVDDIWAYLKSLEPVEHQVKTNQLPFPFNVRESLLLWQQLYFKEGRFQPDPGKSSQWNRGAYLVEAMVHCGSCHTPRDLLGGPQRERRLKGGHIEEWYAPDISNEPGSIIEDWSVDDLKSFMMGETDNKHVPVGSMRDVVDDLSKAREADVEAIAVYLKSFGVGPDRQASPTMQTETTNLAEADHSRGEAIYSNYCSACHGENGGGQPGVVASLKESGAVAAAEPDNVLAVLLEGIGPTGKFGLMPSFRDTLSNKDLAAVANYVRAAWGGRANTSVLPSDVSAKRANLKLDPAVEIAATCPPMPGKALPSDLRDAVAELALQVHPDEEKLKSLIAQYGDRYPESSAEQRMFILGSVYCQKVAESGASKDSVVEREFQFFDMILRLSANEKGG